MYPGSNVIGGGLATGGVALPLTGHNSVWMVVLAATLIVTGAAVIRLTPKRWRPVRR